MVADTAHVEQAHVSLMKSYVVVWLLAIASSQALPVELGTKITPRRLASKVEPPKQQANTTHCMTKPTPATHTHHRYISLQPNH